MTQSQKTYAIAKAAYQAACSAVDEATRNIDENSAEFESACERACEQYKPSEFFRLMIAAEDAMVAECYQRVSSDPKTARQFAASKAQLDHLFQNYLKFPKIHESLVDLCFRLEA